MEYLKNKYSEVELIKKDNWADIYVAINNETREKVQLKLLKTQSDNKKYIDSITYEIDQLQNLKHRNLIGINGIYNFIENNTIYYYIETEYFKSKTLSEKMILTGHTCKESLEIIKQVAEGLNEFHYRGLNYKTLRGENIFIDSQGLAKIDVLSYIQQKYDEDEEYDNYDEFEDGIDKDIYAVGVILYQLITRDQNFKLKKLKKNIEDEEVYSILYSLTSKKIKYRYENLNEFLLDVNEHLQNLSYNANHDLEYINENKREYEDDFEEYEDESSKSVLIKRLCACLAVVLVVVGGIKVAGLVKKDDNKIETQTEMIAEEESTDKEALEEEPKEDKLDEQKVEPTDTSTNDYNLNSDTKDDTNNSTMQTPNYGNDNSTTNNSGSSGSGSTSGGSSSGSGNNGSSNGGSSGSGSSSGSGNNGSTSGGSSSGSGNNGSTSGGSSSGSGNNGSTSGGSSSGSGNNGSTIGGSNSGAETDGSNNDTSDEGTSDDNTSNGDGTNTDSGDEGETSEQSQSME